MKTLLFCNLIPDKLGAYEAYVAALGRVFRGAGDELVPVVAREPVADVARVWRAAGIRWRVLAAWTSGTGREHAWGFCLPAWRLLRDESPDVAAVNFGNELPTLAVAVLARVLLRVPPRWVWIQHQQMRAPSAVTRLASRIRLLMLGVDRFVALYGRGADALRDRGIPSDRIVVMENAIADQPLARAPGWLHAELALPPATPLVVTTSWLIPRKRVDWILRAFASAPAAGDAPAVLLIVGEGPERASLEALARDLGIGGRARFLGRRQDVRDLLPECAVLVLASSAEASAYAIIESMAAGIPSVVTDVGAASEQIVDGESGFVVGVDGANALAARIAALLTDAALRRRLGAAARARFLARYQLEDSVRRYHALYRDLAGHGNRGGA